MVNESHCHTEHDEGLKDRKLAHGGHAGAKPGHWAGICDKPYLWREKWWRQKRVSLLCRWWRNRARAVKRQMKETRNWSWGCSQEQREMGEEEAPAHLWAGSRGMSDLQEVSAKLGGWQLGMEWKEIGKRNLVCVSPWRLHRLKDRGKWGGIVQGFHGSL